MPKYYTEILGCVSAPNKTEVAKKIKAFCLIVSGQGIEQIEKEQMIEEINEEDDTEDYDEYQGYFDKQGKFVGED